jgi:hypothetical protein
LARSLTRTQQAASQRNQTILVNAVSPSIERAKAKLDKLFRQFSGGFIPTDDQIATVLGKDAAPGQTTNPGYSLPDETRLDLNGDGQLDNAWTFESDINGDGVPEKVGYAIISTATQGTVSVADSDSIKATNLVTRFAPLDSVKNTNPFCPKPEFDINQAWQTTKDSSTFRKAFQIVAWAKNPRTHETVTLEVQQDREATLGNRWGAWFRNDLELFPAPGFRWNGAMHTAGNFLFTTSGGQTNLYLVSAPRSCIFSKSASQLTADFFTADAAVRNDGIPFVGQLIIGSNKLNTAEGSISIDLYKDQGPEIDLTNSAADDRIEVTPSTDSVSSGYRPFDISLNPEQLLTLGISNPQGYVPDLDNLRVRDQEIWDQNPLVTNRRVLNQFATQPYVDDTYRADDRWGPNPSYSDPESGEQFSLAALGAKSGDPILNLETLSRNQATNDRLTNFGLDGYWERRAIRQGVRLIVGQRLELGNAFGWQGADDPLYPPLPGPAGNHNVTMSNRRNELKQWKAYRDNLAAVQATAVYHYQSEQGEYPVACIATTTHPGTAQTLANSTTFDNLPNRDQLNVDFLRGQGTNGLEFAPLPRGTFEAEISNSSSNLRKALTNLAYFAGDPAGAFPAQQASAGAVVHPYPYLTQWGNFSELRRSIAALNGGANYASLSPADRTTLQTASCTLGMLAYTLKSYQDRYAALGDLSSLGTALQALEAEVDNPENFERWAAALASDQDKERLRLLQEYLQIQADRRFGFQSRLTQEERSPLCEAAFSNLSPEAREGLTAALCQSTALQTVKFPALYYVFPQSNHGQSNNQPATEPYIADAYINTVNCQSLTPGASCQANLYRAINDSDNNGQEDASAVNAFNNLLLEPRSNPLSWATPVSTESGDRANTISVRGSTWHPAFLDKVIFDGREMMPVRVLDLDLDLLRTTQFNGQDFWLPLPTAQGLEATGAILYAFREDAVREDAIARPSGAAMNATGSSPTDPAVNPTTQISPKPVDYYPDPDRRPYGFRLRKGVSLVREGRNEDGRGLAFISDQPVYIQGDFNLHSTNGSAAASSLIEEFQELLTPNWSNFYSRTNLDSRFARPNQDTWRPAEIISDATTILSDNFCDGNLLDGLNNMDTTSNCQASGANSFRNMNQPEATGLWWQEGGDPTAPVAISRNGLLQVNSGGVQSDYAGGYLAFSAGKSLGNSLSTRINAFLVSGITPSRQGQPYGGLHNFLRLLENWSDLFFQGSFIQLKFSTYATAPYDQDAWEVEQMPSTTKEWISYYQPPARRWGFDVGLLLAPPGVVSQRFRELTPNTSEVYRELSQDDPYICLLRKQLDSDLSGCAS